MHRCPNCSAPHQETDHFCAQCGQKTHQHRFNLPHIFHEFFHAFTHTDKGVLMLTRDLALRPGQVLREYIVEAKRARYFNPFTFLLLVLGFTLFMNSVVKPYTSQKAPTTIQAPTGIRKETEKARYSAATMRQRRVNEWVEKRTNWITLASIPITALMFWLFYRRLNYAEHLVAQVMLAGFYMLAGTLLLLLAFLPPLRSFAIAWGQLLLQAVYLTWSYGQFIGRTGSTRFIRSGLATLCSLLVWTVFSGGLVFLYIMLG